MTYLLVRSQQDPETQLIDSLWVEVYTRDAKGFHNLGIVTRQRHFAEKAPRTDFNWSAWGSQTAHIAIAAARAFNDAAMITLRLDTEGDYFSRRLLDLQAPFDGPFEYHP